MFLVVRRSFLSLIASFWFLVRGSWFLVQDAKAILLLGLFKTLQDFLTLRLSYFLRLFDSFFSCTFLVN